MSDNISNIESIVDKLISSYNSHQLYPAIASSLGYESTPPTISEFISSDEYLGNIFFDKKRNKSSVYDKWYEALQDIYPNPFFSPYVEVCLSGDTEINFLNGTIHKLSDLADTHADKEFWLLSYDIKKQKIVPGLARLPRQTRKSAPLYRVTLDNGTYVDATPDHKFLNINNNWVQVQDLKPGDSLKNCDITISEESWSEILELSKNYNHKVVSVKYISDEPVYCLTVDNYHCFLLPQGIISSNCLSGGIGTGKTTVAKIGMCYDLCRLLLLKDPQFNFNLIPTTIIEYAILNVTAGAAEDVIFSEIIEWFQISPFFKKKLGLSSKRTLLPNGIDVVVGSRSRHIVGRAIFGAILDELNDQSVVNNQAYENYTNVKRRMYSRFAQAGGGLPGHLWLISSHRSDSDFLDAYIPKLRKDPRAIVYEFALWEVKSDTYKADTNFLVFIGDEARDPFILDSVEDKSLVDESRIIEVPDVPGLKDEFKKDIYNALRDMAGVSTVSSFRYIPSIELINKALKASNWFNTEIILLDLIDNTDKLINYLDKNKFNNRVNKQIPRFFHFDFSLSGDKTGVAIGHLSGFVNVSIRDNITGKDFVTRLPWVIYDAVLALKAKPGQEIPLFKLRDFILDLSTSGLNIGVISTDGFQSSQFRQELKAMSYSTDLISMDRTPTPYYELKQAIYQGRANICNHSLLKKELSELIRLSKGKIDHPSSGCFIGNTRIFLLDGTNPTIENLYHNYQNKYVHSLDLDNNKLVPGKIINCFITKYVKKLYRITLDNNEVIECTNNHLFLLRDKSYKRADLLTVDDCLMPIYPNKFNYKILNIKVFNLIKKIPVYDITVDKYHNFALSAGVFVHNSKDIADACAGVYYSISNNAANYSFFTDIKDALLKDGEEFIVGE